MSNQIPAHVLDCICDLFTTETKEKLCSYLNIELEISTDCFNSYIQEILDKHFSSEPIDVAQIKTTFYRKKQLNKKNWIKALRKEMTDNVPNPISKEISSYKRLLNQHSTRKQEILELLSVAKLEDLYDKRIEELEEWAKDKNTLLTDYFYLDDLKVFQIIRAFETDVVYIIANYFKEQNYDGQWTKAIKQRPVELLHIPWADKVVKTKPTITKETNDITVYSEEYKVGDHLIRAMFEVKKDELIYFKNVYALDNVDSDIIQYVLEQIGPEFYSDSGDIDIDLVKLAKAVYINSARSGKVLDLLKQRIRRLATYSQSYFVVDKENEKVKREYILNVFQEVVINEEEKRATIKLAERIRENIINRELIEVYTDIKESLTNKASSTLIFSLQKERIDLHVLNKGYKKHFDYFYYQRKMRLHYKRLERNYQLISEALEEFEKINVIIKSFKRNGTGFDIEFLPLSESEIKDFSKYIEYTRKHLNNQLTLPL
ncbi:hypothetical protein [Viridibacillus arvi]|uniref:hypothetical protein n=1 Tax=Viridibacillus arvi TaxID=263475 RepID=UPI0034CDAE7E